MKFRVWPGRPYPLGASWDGAGVNFALYSENATSVEICLFKNASDTHEMQRVRLKEEQGHVWCAYLPEARPGQLYGYRVYGPYDPINGHRFNPAKLLIDPYAKAIAGDVKWSDALFAYTVGSKEEDLAIDTQNTVTAIPKCMVMDTTFSWATDTKLNTPWHKTLIYELHVKGFTKLHPELPPELRGTYAGLGSPAIIDYLLSLGITAVELMPIHHSASEKHLIDAGLSNYWGYSSIGYFAPDPRFSASGFMGGQVAEFQTMVKSLHRAGIEVILDVVYNHTAEGNHLGPTLSFKGIDNACYYRLSPKNKRYYMDYTGCGNTLNLMNPRTLQLIMDSLRYWINEMHVDGFRFDLASTLAREAADVDRLGSFFDVIQQDPVISRAKLIAEPWDLGAGGYQVGKFPALWAEWNDQYRDTVRRFWKGDPAQAGPMGYRVTGSSDIYGWGGRRPFASINFITAHDGFTLRDWTSYNHKHNNANKEDNRDGSDNNCSWNCGEEGETDDQEILTLRAKQMRNMLATLILSQGVPMLLSGDEIARTQRGNNNAYCQDNQITWTNWCLSPEQTDLLRFTQELITQFHSHPVLRRRKYFHGRNIRGSEVKDITWFRHDGKEMQETDWANAQTKCFGLRLAGDAIDEVDDFGHPIADDTFLILFNAHYEKILFTMPAHRQGLLWEMRLDTHRWGQKKPRRLYRGGKLYPLEARSLVLLRQIDKEKQSEF